MIAAICARKSVAVPTRRSTAVDDGRVGLTEVLQDDVARHLNRKIQQHHVRRVDGDELERLGAVRGDLDGVAEIGQRVAKYRGDAGLIVHDQHPGDR